MAIIVTIHAHLQGRACCAALGEGGNVLYSSSITARTSSGGPSVWPFGCLQPCREAIEPQVDNPTKEEASQLCYKGCWSVQTLVETEPRRDALAVRAAGLG